MYCKNKNQVGDFQLKKMKMLEIQAKTLMGVKSNNENGDFRMLQNYQFHCLKISQKQKLTIFAN